MEQQLVVFKLAEEFYGVDIAAVEGIIKVQDITRIPRLPRFVEGVINLRGSIIPVLDLRKRFDLPQSEATDSSRVIVINMHEIKVGMTVDSVSEVINVDQDWVSPPPPLTLNADSTFITGIAKVDDRLVILLDLTKLLSGKEKLALGKLA